MIGSAHEGIGELNENDGDDYNANGNDGNDKDWQTFRDGCGDGAVERRRR